MITPDIGNAGAAMLGGSGVALGFLFGWLRAASKIRVTTADDTAHVGMISRLQRERDEAAAEAKTERQQRTEDARTIARLLAEVEYKDREILRLVDRKRQAEAEAGWPSTNHAPLENLKNERPR